MDTPEPPPDRSRSNPPEHLSALPSGYRLHDYEIVSVLGVGGFGITYLATDTQLGMQVAVKEYLPNTLAVRTETSTVLPKSTTDENDYRWGLDRFMKEAQTLARFRHLNIVRVLRFFEANGTGYTVMEYERGQSLAAYLRAHPTAMRESELLKLILPLLDGLERVHEAGFLHRDIKPANIYLREDGAPVLIDFGSARQAMGSQTQSLTSVFTPGYAPFEQYFSDGKQGPWTDIYALGAVLYRLVTGKSPPDAAKRIKQDTLEPASILCRGRYSAGFLHAIDQALLMDEQARPQSIDAWLGLLASTGVSQTAVPSKTVDATTVVVPASSTAAAAVRSPSPVRHARRAKNKHSVLKRVVLILLVLLVVGGVAKHLKQRRLQAKAPAAAAARPHPEPRALSAPERPVAAPTSSVPALSERDTLRDRQQAKEGIVPDAGTGADMPSEREPSSAGRPRSGAERVFDARFAQADTDGDGYLSRAEASKAFPRLARAFGRVDRDRDGRLSEQEIQRAIAYQLQHRFRPRERR